MCYNVIVTFNFLNSSVKTVEFRNINNLEQVVLRYSTDFRPMRMCVFQSILLCEVTNGNQLVVKWFDCSTSPPKPATDVSITHTHTNKNSKECCPNHYIFHMCIVNSGAKQLLVTVTKSGKLRAFDTQADELEWEAGRNLRDMKYPFSAKGLTIDGCHLFVIDSGNKCVQMFSTDGKYLKCIFKAVDYALGYMNRIQWLNKTSSLVVWNTRDGQNYINVIEINL